MEDTGFSRFSGASGIRALALRSRSLKWRLFLLTRRSIWSFLQSDEVRSD
jgi:hypothetical protein